METKKLFKFGSLVLLILMVVLAFSSFVIVGAGERGVLLKLGAVQDKIFVEGIHFVIPGIERIVLMDVKTKKLEVNATASSKDLQDVHTVLALNYHIDPLLAHRLYQNVGKFYEATIVAPTVQESIKSATALFTAAELIAERPRVRDEIKKSLESKLSSHFIKVDEVSIVNFEFSDSFRRAIEEKQVAQQNALKAENDLRRIQIEAQQKIETAKADAESIRIQAEALQQNQNLVKLKAVEKWDGILPKFMTGSTVPFIDLGKVE